MARWRTRAGREPLATVKAGGVGVRELTLYTAVTRAKQLVVPVVLVGSRRALAAAVRTVGAGRRHTALDHRLAPTGR